MPELCQVEGCKDTAKFALYRFSGSTKEWLHVCPWHDREIASENKRHVPPKLGSRRSRRVCFYDGITDPVSESIGF